MLTGADRCARQAALAKSLQEIQRQVAEAGIDYRLLHGARHDARSGGTPTIKLAYQRPVAVPPPCDDWTRDVGRNEERIPYPNWGCATQHNLAVTVDNARDLGQPQAEDPRSASGAASPGRPTWAAAVLRLATAPPPMLPGALPPPGDKARQANGVISAPRADAPRRLLATSRLVLRFPSQYRAAHSVHWP